MEPLKYAIPSLPCRTSVLIALTIKYRGISLGVLGFSWACPGVGLGMSWAACWLDMGLLLDCPELVLRGSRAVLACPEARSGVTLGLPCVSFQLVQELVLGSFWVCLSSSWSCSGVALAWLGRDLRLRCACLVLVRGLP